MRTLMAILLAGVALTAATLPSLAEDSAAAVVQKAALVVIAPAKSDIARIIKTRLQDAYYDADPASRAHGDSDLAPCRLAPPTTRRLPQRNGGLIAAVVLGCCSGNYGELIERRHPRSARAGA